MKKYLLGLLLASLALVGCGNSETPTSSGSESTTSNTPTSSETSNPTTSQETSSIEESVTSETPASSEASDLSASQEDSSVVDEPTDWDETSKAKFEQYFNGYTIPFVPMGTISYLQTGGSTEGEDVYLELTGTRDANLLTFKGNAIELGYVIKEYEATEDDPAYLEAFYGFDTSNYSYSLSITYSASDVSGSGAYMCIYKPGTKENNSYESVEEVKEAVHTACSLPDEETWIDLNQNAENPWYQIEIETSVDSTEEAMEACSTTYFNLVKDGVIAANVTEEVTYGVDGYEFAFSVTTDNGDVTIYSVILPGDTETDNCFLNLQVYYGE